MEGVQREQGRHRGAGPAGRSHPQQGQEQQHAGGRVQGDVDGVVPPRPLGAEALADEHVREHRQRMPVGDGGAGKRLDEACSGEPVADVIVRGDELGVVVVDEVVAAGGPVDGRDGQNQEKDDGDRMKEIG